MGRLDVIDIIKEIGLRQGKSGIQESLRGRSPTGTGQAPGTRSS